ncbi:hypothetical protein CYY_008553 [Polysphondylium violaceum]|uniref:Thioredoxin domain-containing protein n=1 Tax=Polysphondylium violaceum TaxID=133409 RepID=A0A8J4PN73_9MYCE|nr:hypothetical protein CYY_008553 [Polysphondylium violaceum]
MTSTTGFTLLTTGAEFIQKYNRSDNKLIVFYVTKDNCPPCDVLAPKIKKWKETAAYNNCEFYEINSSHFTRATPDDIEFREITTFPSIKFYKNYVNTDDGYIAFFHNSADPQGMFLASDSFLVANKS